MQARARPEDQGGPGDRLGGRAGGQRPHQGPGDGQALQADTKENPMDWWCENHTEFPLLAKFWLAHSCFPATSASAERAFNMDGLILTDSR